MVSDPADSCMRIYIYFTGNAASFHLLQAKSISKLRSTWFLDSNANGLQYGICTSAYRKGNYYPHLHVAN